MADPPAQIVYRPEDLDAIYGRRIDADLRSGGRYGFGGAALLIYNPTSYHSKARKLVIWS